MFRVTMCPSSGETTIYVKLCTCYSAWMTVWYAGAYAPAYKSGETTVFMRHLVLVILCG